MTEPTPAIEQPFAAHIAEQPPRALDQLDALAAELEDVELPLGLNQLVMDARAVVASPDGVPLAPMVAGTIDRILNALAMTLSALLVLSSAARKLVSAPAAPSTRSEVSLDGPMPSLTQALTAAVSEHARAIAHDMPYHDEGVTIDDADAAAQRWSGEHKTRAAEVAATARRLLGGQCASCRQWGLSETALGIVTTIADEYGEALGAELVEPLVLFVSTALLKLVDLADTQDAQAPTDASLTAPRDGLAIQQEQGSREEEQVVIWAIPVPSVGPTVSIPITEHLVSVGIAALAARVVVEPGALAPTEYADAAWLAVYTLGELDQLPTSEDMAGFIDEATAQRYPDAVVGAAAALMPFLKSRAAELTEKGSTGGTAGTEAPSEHLRYHELVFDAISWLFDTGPDGWETRLGDALNEAVVVVRAVIQADGDVAAAIDLTEGEPFFDRDLRDGLVAYIGGLARPCQT